MNAEATALTGVTPSGTAAQQRPPGERYFRHPGDVLRLVGAAIATVVLAVFIGAATATSEGVTADLGRVAGRVPTSAGELLLALAQVAVVSAVAALVVLLLVQQRWRRLGVLFLGAVSAAVVFMGLDALLDLEGRLPDAVDGGTWLASARFPGPVHLAAIVGATTVGKPWLARSWRRSADLAVLGLVATMVLAGSAGVPELLLAAAVGLLAGAAVLVVVGAPNRRPSPASVAAALRDGGLDVGGLELVRAESGRSQLYTADGASLTFVPTFVKVYAEDSRDADLLYRGFRSTLLKDVDGPRTTHGVADDVEHHALLLVLAERAGVTCPALRGLVILPDGSAALALERIDGRPLDTVEPEAITPALLDAVWREATTLHGAGLAHGALRARNVLVGAGDPTIIDFGSAQASAAARFQAIDRAELLTSLGVLAGPGEAVASAARVLPADDLASALPYLQPMALSAGTRSRASKKLLAELRAAVAEVTGEEAQPLERLVRVRPRTLVTIAALTGAFYVLLPQLANVDDSFEALRSANWAWLVVCIAMSALTYLASATALAGGVPGGLPLAPTFVTQLASSFVNRVTPANVGGMALNVRFMQKAGVDPSVAVAAMGLNVIAGGIIHAVLLVLFFAWAGQGGDGFALPGGSRILVIVAALLAVAGLLLATPWGRRLFQKHVVRFVRRSWSTTRELISSPAKLAQLLGGSLGVTMAYVTGLAAAVAAFGGGVTFAEVGAVYLGSSMIAAAAPTPGGLGALEAALVAGFTGVGLEPGVAVAAVLSYRLATYWLPILPGWLCFHTLERRDLI